jgi:hypothetical protein
MVVTDISLIGWFIGNYKHASTGLLVADLVAIAIISAGIMELHRRIERQIEHLREL